MKIVVDRGKCTALGICESLAPDVFQVDDEGDLGLLQEEVPDELRSLVDPAVFGCPTAALSLVDG